MAGSINSSAIASQTLAGNRKVSMLLDILRALKGADFLSTRSMSRTEEDISSRVDITNMRDTTLSGRFEESYSDDGGRTWVPAFIANLTREKP
jgi:hypothetical protein